MLIEERLRDHLAADSGLSGTIGTRIFPLLMPQEPTLPALVYTRISGPRDNTHDGPSGLVSTRIQISCWATSYKTAKQTADLVRLALADFEKSTLDNELDFYEPDTKLFSVPLDFMILHTEEN